MQYSECLARARSALGPGSVPCSSPCSCDLDKSTRNKHKSMHNKGGRPRRKHVFYDCIRSGLIATGPCFLHLDKSMHNKGAHAQTSRHLSMAASGVA